MRSDLLADYLLSLPETREEQPFGPDVDVYKVAGKIFAIFSPDTNPRRISLKCDPILAIELRQEYDAVNPGYHLNKNHWNTVTLDGTVHTHQLKSMIRHSYEQVVLGLPKSVRERLAGDV
ncbi:MAG TPA: MmcQ/YjbR family DNA-binding protein [Acidimicrobiales bacterium]|nr:MmcQ/YjbR family DNA-binding protein [Acidimicrobiales bacterium]